MDGRRGRGDDGEHEGRGAGQGAGSRSVPGQGARKLPEAGSDHRRHVGGRRIGVQDHDRRYPGSVRAPRVGAQRRLRSAATASSAGQATASSGTSGALLRDRRPPPRTVVELCNSTTRPRRGGSYAGRSSGRGVGGPEAGAVRGRRAPPEPEHLPPQPADAEPDHDVHHADDQAQPPPRRRGTSPEPKKIGPGAVP